ncbi:UvrD-helicase domain-containing protein [Bacillus mycoides]|uniref:UvrD-helicase domain-containing protein n=1 Tax=Bacillus mycoides TaxID=1405 RepID=UPI0034641AF7
MTIEKHLELITPQILPIGCDFFDQQKKAIIADGSLNIVAGPGSGKTTVLIAKCALLLKQISNSNKGICLITHTNVAVDEIKMGLKRLGIDNVEYPNFIGTIQDFFNTFFAKKAFHLVHGEKKFRVLDDDEYKEKFEELFQQRKPDWYTTNAPRISKLSPKILISNDLSFSIISNAKSSYKAAFEESIKLLFSWGIVNNNQCLELAKWYFERHEDHLKRAMLMRFKYVLLDEAQDTNSLQYEMLTRLFSDPKVFFQKFGDPYQSLYSIFEDNNDAWVPSAEPEITYQEISETSRFGTSIANIVKNVCIEEYSDFKSLDLTQSFSPYYIIYENEDDLLKQYRRLVNSCKEESGSFSHSEKKDAILSAFHNDLNGLFSKYTRPSTKPRKNESHIRKIYNFLLGLLSKEVDISFKELKDKVDLNLNCRVKISKCIREMVNEDFLVDSFISNLEEALIFLTDGAKKQFSNVSVESQVEYFRQFLLSSEPDDLPEVPTEFYIGTIHSAKGETHRSTLLVLDTVFKVFLENTNVEFSMFDLLKEYFVGNYIDPNTITDSIVRNETLKSLKLAYVALSRPTHLMVIAIPEHLIVKDSSILERMNDSGWKQYEQFVHI